MFRRWHLSILFLPAAAACSFLSNADEPQCSATSDCLARGARFAGTICVASQCVQETTTATDAGPIDSGVDAEVPDPVWGCIGKPVTDPGTSTVHATNVFFDLVGLAPYGQLPLKLCGASDVTCAAPVGSTVTDDAGMATFDMAANFSGYISAMVPPPEAPDLLPTIFYSPYVPLSADAAPPQRGMVRTATFNSIAAVRGQTISPNNGYVLAVTTDCRNLAASGIRVDIESGRTASGTTYIKNGFPTTSDTGTIDFGIAIVLDVTTSTKRVSDGGPYLGSTVEVTATRSETGQVTTKRTILVKPGLLTTVVMSPAIF